MDFRRGILYFALAMLGVMLWHAWQHDYTPQSVSGVTNPVSAQVSPSGFTPASYGNSPVNAATVANPTTQNTPGKIIHIKTDVIDANINLVGGDLVGVKLLHYPVSLQEKNTPITLLNPSNDTLYVAQSGLSVPDQKTAAKPIQFQSAKSEYALEDGENQLVVTLTGKTNNGIEVEKMYTFTRSNYAIHTAMTLKNLGSTPWSGNIYNQITRRYVSTGYSRAYDGASVATQNTPYKKLTFAHLSENNFTRDTSNGWIAMQQQYFLSAWIPPKSDTLRYYSRSFGNGDDGKNNVFILGYLSPSIHLMPNTGSTFNSTLYVGPEIAKNLDSLAKGLGLTVDYGFLWPISKFLFWLMSEIHHFVGNWGWSIILVTVFIKIAFYWLSNKSYVSMAKTRHLQPKIKSLKDRHGDDKQAMSRAMMELYKAEKINPVGGCLPMIIQIPVFIALYYVLIESVELRQAPFMFWIHDLSVKDPYFILPIIMGISMLIQQKLSPPPPDPAQAKMMMMLPIVFTVFFATFPAGLVLYWITNNCVSILQQWFVMRTHARTVTTVRRI